MNQHVRNFAQAMLKRLERDHESARHALRLDVSNFIELAERPPSEWSAQTLLLHDAIQEGLGKELPLGYLR